MEAKKSITCDVCAKEMFSKLLDNGVTWTQSGMTRTNYMPEDQTPITKEIATYLNGMYGPYDPYRGHDICPECRLKAWGVKPK